MRSVLLALTMVMSVPAQNWPQWRGPLLNGTSAEKNLPVKWSSTEGVLWKLAMPNRSGATPIIWGNKIFLSVADAGELFLWCVDKANGTVLWKQPLGGGDYKINKQNMSSPSPVTDGTSVFALTGTGILKAFDFTGKELWTRDFQKEYGKFRLKWGYGSSPLLWEDALYVQVLNGDQQGDVSYLLRIDRKTGKNVWKMERETEAIREGHDSYRTPMPMKAGGKTQIVLADGDGVSAHDPDSGKVLWRARGLNPDENPNYRVIASPLVVGDVVVVPSRIKPMIAFRAGGEKLWSFDKGPDVPTPVSDGKKLWVIGDRGIAWCLDVKTGAVLWGPERIKNGVYSASPMIADGKIYATSEDGVTTVLGAGDKFEVLAENELGGFTLSSPAVSEGKLYMRTAAFLFAVGK